MAEQFSRPYEPKWSSANTYVVAAAVILELLLVAVMMFAVVWSHNPASNELGRWLAAALFGGVMIWIAREFLPPFYRWRYTAAQIRGREIGEMEFPLGEDEFWSLMAEERPPIERVTVVPLGAAGDTASFGRVTPMMVAQPGGRHWVARPYTFKIVTFGQAAFDAAMVKVWQRVAATDG